MDVISQTLTSIRNANNSKNPYVILPYISINQTLVQILQTEGFIDSFEIDQTQIIIHLKYMGQDQKPILTNLQRISTPGRRVYIHCNQIPQLFGGLGILLISTSSGVMTNKQAQKLKVGGELICSIW